jgi:hypothetical protein
MNRWMNVIILTTTTTTTTTTERTIQAAVQWK